MFREPSPPFTTRRRHAAAPQFACTWESGGSRAAWVYVAGEVDLATTPELKFVLGEARAHARLVVLDLREVTFIDASGIRAILEAAAEARRRWGRLMLIRGSVPVERMLTLSRVTDQILTFDLDADEPSSGLLDAG